MLFQHFSDIDLGDILQVIETNVERNRHLLRENNVTIMELDFKADQWSPELVEKIKEVDVVFAADGNF